MDENEINEELKRLKSSSKEYADLVDNLFRDQKRMAQDDKKAGENTIKFIKAIEEANKRFKKSYLEIDSSIKILNEAYKKGALSAEDLEEELDLLRNQINRTTDQDKKAALVRAKSELERANAGNKASEIFRTSLGTLSGTIAKGFVNQMTSAAKAALGGGDAMDVAAASMTAQIDMYNSTAQVGASALMDFGKVAAGAGGKLGMVGVAAAGLGAAISMVSNGMSDLAKAGVGFMLTQTRQLIGNFQQMSAAGAIYSGGMMEMIGSSQNAGMTLEQFSKAITANKDVLAKTGLGITAASKLMSNAMAAGGQSAREGMYALGMNMEQQADAYAQTMAVMAGPTGRLKATQEEVAASTQEYARNLKIVSSITGEDGKAKQEKIRQENDTLAFNQKLAAMSKEQRDSLNAAMLNMNDSQRQALRENMIYGGVISKDLAVAQATNRGIRDANDQFFQAVKDGSISAEKARQIQADTSKETMQDAINNKGLAMARGDSAVAAAKINNEALKTAAMSDQERIKAAEDAAKSLQDKGKKGEGGVEVTLMRENQRLLTDMQALAAKNLGLFATAVSATIKELNQQVSALEKVGKGDVVGGIMDFIKQNLGTVASVVGSTMLSNALTPKQGGGVPAGTPVSNNGGFGPGTKGAASSTPTAASKASGLLSKLSSRISSVLPTVSGTFSKLGAGLSAAAPVLGKVAKAAPWVGTALATFSAVSDIKDVDQQVKNKKITKKQGQEKKGKIAGGAVGSAVGSVLGGVVGSFLGPVGTVGGAALGSYLGKKFGEAAVEGFGAQKIGEMVDDISNSIGIFGDYASKTFSNLKKSAVENFETFKKFASETFSNLGTNTSKMFSNLDKSIGEMSKDAVKAIGDMYTSGKEMVINLGTAISDTFTKSKEWAVNKVNAIRTVISDTFNAIPGVVASVGTAISDTFTKSKDWVVGKVDAIRTVISDTFNAIPRVVASVGTAIGDTFNAIPGVVASVGTAISDTFTKSKDWVVGKVDAISDTFSDTFNAIPRVVASVGTAISDTFNAIPRVVASVGKAISDTFNGIPIVVIAKALVAAVSDTFNKIPGVVAGVGTAISDTFNDAKNTVGSIVSGIGSVVASTFNGISEIVASVGAIIDKTTSTIASGVGYAFEGITGGISKVGTVVSGVGSSIASTIKGVGSAISGITTAPLQLIADLVQKITDLMPEWVKMGAVKFGGAVSDAASAFSGTVGNVAGNVGNAVGNVAGNVGNAVGNFVGNVGSTVASAFKDMIKFGSNTGDEQHFNQLDPAVRSRFTQMAAEYNQQTGKSLQVNSAFRSPQEQADVNSGTNPKALPGKSLHNVGRAVDINSGQVTELASAGLLSKYGFSPLPGDPPHIQSLDSGGDIPSGQLAIAGERGGELITGPASVTGRVTTEMLVSKLSDLVDLSKQMISINQDMIRVMSDHKDVSRKILNATA